MTKKSKQTLSLFVILIILLIAFFFWQNPFNQKSNQAKTDTIIISNLDNTTKIEIAKGETVTQLEKLNDQWVVASEENAAANMNLVNGLLNSLENTETGIIVSTNPDKLANFNLSDELATKLSLEDNQGNKIELLIGKNGGPELDNTYVKKTDSNNILLADENLSRKVIQPDWKQPPPTENDTEPQLEIQ